MSTSAADLRALPGLPPAVAAATRGAWKAGALVRLDGRCLCCGPDSPASRVDVLHVGGDYELAPGADASLIAALGAAGFELVDRAAARWTWSAAS